jgi:fructose 1,6-bisphosphate aldolase/phosphatase
MVLKKKKRSEKMEKITISLIKADVGGFPGHSTVRPESKEKAREQMEKAKKEGLLVDYHVLNAGDDLQLLMSHRKGVDSEEIHGLAWKRLKKRRKWRKSSSCTVRGKICSRMRSAGT